MADAESAAPAVAAAAPAAEALTPPATDAPQPAEAAVQALDFTQSPRPVSDKPLIQQLVEAGTHFGHRTARWNPKMKPYIYSRRKQIHIINLRETVKGLIRASHILEELAKRGGDILIVGTKRQAADIVRHAAAFSGMHFVVHRWLGGTLTNYRTIRSRLKRLEELEGMDRTGAVLAYSKKMQVRLRRERDKIHRNLEGMRRLESVPAAILVVDARREQNALREARLLDIPTFGIIDTDSDPDSVDVAIPANDDAYRSIQIVLGTLAEAVKRGTDAFRASPAYAQKLAAAAAANAPAGGGGAGRGGARGGGARPDGRGGEGRGPRPDGPKPDAPKPPRGRRRKVVAAGGGGFEPDPTPAEPADGAAPTAASTPTAAGAPPAEAKPTVDAAAANASVAEAAAPSTDS